MSCLPWESAFLGFVFITITYSSSSSSSLYWTWSWVWWWWWWEGRAFLFCLSKLHKLISLDCSECTYLSCFCLCFFPSCQGNRCLFFSPLQGRGGGNDSGSRPRWGWQGENIFLLLNSSLSFNFFFARLGLLSILNVLQPRENVFMNPIFVDNFELIFQKESLFRLASPNLRQWWTIEEEEEEGGFQQSDCKVIESGIGTFPSVSPIKTHWSCTDKILCVFNSNLLLQFKVIHSI